MIVTQHVKYIVTLSEVDALHRLGTTLSVFMLGEDPRLEQFVNIVARRGGGRVLAPDADGLGAAVVGDYLRIPAEGGERQRSSCAIQSPQANADMRVGGLSDA